MRIIISALAWAAIWGLALALFAYFEESKNPSWLLGTPLCLPASVAIWGTIRGTVRFHIPGALCGVVLGAALGYVGFLVSASISSDVNGLTARDVPVWWTRTTIFAVAGLAGGGLVGGIAGLMETVMQRNLRE
jgi:hypothetical protein